MAKPTAIVVWFDDDTRYHLDPAVVRSIFMSEQAASECGHGGPHQVPGPTAPIRGPFTDHQGPPPTTNGGAAGAGTATTLETTCYYVNGVIVCP